MSDNPVKSERRDVEARYNIFVEQYLTNGFNATAAAIEAGFSPKSAPSKANELLNDPRIQLRLKKEYDRRRVQFEVNEARVMQELASIALLDMAELYDDQGKLLTIHEMPERARRALSSIRTFTEYEGFGRDREAVGETKLVNVESKIKALELLGKHFKMFTDKIEHGANDDLASLILAARKRGNAKQQQTDSEDFLK